MVSHVRNVLGDNLAAVTQDAAVAQCYASNCICSPPSIATLVKSDLSTAMTASYMQKL
jgi:hypothetical protein